MSNELLKQIHERVQALPDDIPTEARVQELVEQIVSDLVSDPEFVRKMRFGTDGDKRLVGSKFGRWGLGVADIEHLYDLMRAAHDFRPQTYPGPSEELENAFQDISDAMYISQEEIQRIDKRAIDNQFPRVPVTMLPLHDQRLYGRNARFAGDGPLERTTAYQRAARAMDTAESGYGSQLVGAQYVGELWVAARQQARIFNMLDTFEMTAPTAYLPVEADIPEMLFVGESTSASASNYATSKTGSNRVQVDAKKFVIHQMWSGEMEEDSIIPFVPFLRAQVIKALAHYSDSVVLNGDTTNAATGNINLDDADPDDTKHYLAFDGILHAALVDNTNANDDVGGAAITYEDLTHVPGRMVDTTYLMDWGHPTDPMDLVYAFDPETADRIATLDELTNWKIQQGRQLLALPGQVGEIVGHPVIGSIAISKGEADGKVSTTGSNNTLGRGAIFNKRAFVAGWRRRVKVMMEQLPATDQVRMVHSLRLGFGRYSPTGAASAIAAARALYNIDLS